MKSPSIENVPARWIRSSCSNTGSAGATAEKFTANGWGRTGDLAKCDEDGYFWYQGRADDVFKSGGYRIGPPRSKTVCCGILPSQMLP